MAGPGGEAGPLSARAGGGPGEALSAASGRSWSVPAPGSLRRVLVISTRYKVAAHPCAREIASWFRERGIGCELNLAGEGDVRAQAAQVDLVVCVGGDGTILGVARGLRGVEVPTIGLHIGKLGFLAEFTAEDIRAYLDHARRPFRVVPRLMLACRLRGGEPLYALNDAVLTQGPMARILEIDMEVDGRRATRYYADGVVVSTPVGSTAYSLSLGGPLVMPGMDAIIVTPIAPHALTNRPLVLEGGVRLGFRIRRESPSLALVVDGQEIRRLEKGDEVTIERAPTRFLLASHTRRTHFDILRRKLHWAIQPTGGPAAPGLLSDARRGSPLAVVYLHGFASSPGGRKARLVAGRLRQKGVSCEVPDLNEGPGGFTALTVTRMIEAAARAAERARRLAGLPDAAPIVLVGSSLGGYVASLVAARDPSVAGLVLLAPAFRFAERLRDSVGAEGEGALPAAAADGSFEVFHHGRGEPARVGAGLLEDGLRYEPFPKVSCPTLVVHGRRDKTVPVSLSERFAEGRANVQLLVLDDDHRLSRSIATVGLSVETFIDAIGRELRAGQDSGIFQS